MVLLHLAVLVVLFLPVSELTTVGRRKREREREREREERERERERERVRVRMRVGYLRFRQCNIISVRLVLEVLVGLLFLSLPGLRVFRENLCLPADLVILVLPTTNHTSKNGLK